jgi:hypothetical protein
MSKLAPKDAKIKIGLYTLAVLMYNFVRAQEESDVTFEEATERLDEFLTRMNLSQYRFHVSVQDLEQLLYTANMVEEAGKGFVSLKKDESFDKFLQQLFWYSRLGHDRLKFDRDFNTIVYHGKEGGEDV